MKLVYFFLILAVAFGQNIDVTFRYVKKSTDDFLRVFVPGTMPSGTSQDWGPNSNGMISSTVLDTSIISCQMHLVASRCKWK